MLKNDILLADDVAYDDEESEYEDLVNRGVEDAGEYDEDDSSWDDSNEDDWDTEDDDDSDLGYDEDDDEDM